ncbi:hypothetical protein Hypma_013574 [Hypsizygus marmoreus]|uniref:Uncharacterized protein n=1 Tax=Hypsizygus marmoreus TaxID=39966 RepID=A0A369JB83_HYPMA|nr:hypothetical protein Hypma_013574 [Hypsizygus marmoreus]
MPSTSVLPLFGAVRHLLSDHRVSVTLLIQVSTVFLTCTVNIYFLQSLETSHRLTIFSNGHQIFTTPRHGETSKLPKYILHITLSAYCISATACTASLTDRGSGMSDVGPGHGCQLLNVHYVDR